MESDFLRCVLDTANDQWLVYDRSGNIYYFGETAASRVSNSKQNWSGETATFHWALDKIDTATGDETTIAYNTYNSPYSGLVANTGLSGNVTVPENTLYPASITYNSHVNLNNGNGYTSAFQGRYKIVFGLVGGTTPTLKNDYRFSYRSGCRTEDNYLLSTITSMTETAGGTWNNVWQYTLGYTTSPATGRSLLKTVNVTGYDVNGQTPTALPTQTFTYQGSQVSFASPIQWTGLILTAPGSTTAYESLISSVDNGPITVADLIDMDGDGLPDRVCWDGTGSPGSRDKYQVQKKLGLAANGLSGSYSGTRTAFGSTSTGSGAAAASNPIPDGMNWGALNTIYGRIRDINGDGLPDRVMDDWSVATLAGPPYPSFTKYEVMLNNGGGFSGESNWPLGSAPVTPSDGSQLDYYCVESGGVDVGFFDINGDGLPDRVMANWYTEGPMTNFLVQLNTGNGFSAPRLYGPYYSQNFNGSATGENNDYVYAGIETPESHMIDINGDGLPDRVLYPQKTGSAGTELPGPTDHYLVEYNNGHGFEAINNDKTDFPGQADRWNGVVGTDANGFNRTDAIENLPYVGMFDVNGDGLPDRVMVDLSTIGNAIPSWVVYLNNGHGFSTTPSEITGINADGAPTGAGVTPTWWGPEGSVAEGVESTLIDMNGDGLLDRVVAVYDPSGNNTTKPYFWVQLNQGPFPDLMTNIDNGIGGVVGVSYVPSTTWDNRKDPNNPQFGSTLPFIQQTVGSITTSDGINPPATTTYGYAGGFFDGSRREFAGFGVVTNIDPTARKTITYFHTGGGRNYSASGEYNDPGSFAKRGMPYRTETWGNDNALYKVEINLVDQNAFSYAGTEMTYYRYFPFISESFY